MYFTQRRKEKKQGRKGELVLKISNTVSRRCKKTGTLCVFALLCAFA
jgi:hypothetical protein